MPEKPSCAIYDAASSPVRVITADEYPRLGALFAEFCIAHGDPALVQHSIGAVSTAALLAICRIKYPAKLVVNQRTYIYDRQTRCYTLQEVTHERTRKP